MRPPIKSKKHYVQITRSTVATVARNVELLAHGTETTSASNPDDVAEGSVLKAVFVELWLENSSNTGSFGVGLEKTPVNNSPSFSDYSSLSSYDNKKNIFYYTQGLPANDGVGNPIPILRQWFKMPKSKQRFGLGDKLQLVIVNFGADTLTYCGFATYKEYQ